jgi:hypothetical protein
MRNPVNYEAVLKHEDVIVSLSKEERDINVFLPVRGRLTFIAPCLKYLKESEKRSGMKVNVVIIENDDTPKYLPFCKPAGIDYIFIPSSISCSDGMFAKALCYNIGFIATPKTEWNVFHDLDILVEKDYFTKLKEYLKPESTWIQPYTKKRVIRLDAQDTKTIVRNPDEVVDLEGKGSPSNPGSPGGSIVVKSTDFINIGGYDPEYFYGYSPEDAFFWAKLEVLHKEISEVFQTHFQGSAVYADDPAIEVYHLDHPPAEGTNSKLNLMINYLSSYYRSSYRRKRQFIDMKRDYFVDTLSRIGA